MRRQQQQQQQLHWQRVLPPTYMLGTTREHEDALLGTSRNQHATAAAGLTPGGGGAPTAPQTP